MGGIKFLKNVTKTAKNAVTGKKTDDALDIFGTERKAAQSEPNMANIMKQEAAETKQAAKQVSTGTKNNTGLGATSKTGNGNDVVVKSGASSANSVAKASSNGYGASVAKTAIRTAGGVGLLLGGAGIASAAAPSLLATDDTTDTPDGGTDTTGKRGDGSNGGDSSTGGSNGDSGWFDNLFGGGTATVGGDGYGDEGTSFSESVSDNLLTTLKEYAPFVIGAIIVILIISYISSPEPQKDEKKKNNTTKGGTKA